MNYKITVLLPVMLAVGCETVSKCPALLSDQLPLDQTQQTTYGDAVLYQILDGEVSQCSVMVEYAGN